MRKSILIVALTAAVPLMASTIKPARAEIVYPYCTGETRWEGPHCDYRTLEECVAAAAGFAYTCGPIPWYTAPQSSARRPVR